MNRIILPILLGGLIILSSCRRDKEETADYTTAFTTASEDNARFGNGMDAIDNEINELIDLSPGFNSRANPLCNATVVYDTTGAVKTATITFNGLNCAGTHDRQGVVVISLPQGVHWEDAGAVLTVTSNNLEITRVSDSKHIVINGSRTITNVSGGLLMDLSSLGTIEHDVASNGIVITFDDGTERSWQLARHRVFTYDNGVVSSTTGTATQGGFSNVAEWGTTRNGQPFYSQITSPMTVRQDCSFRLTEGRKVFHRMQREVTVAFGLDASGNPTSCPGAGAPYYLKAEWTDLQGNAHSVIKPY